MEQIETDDWHRRLIKGRLESYIVTGQDLPRVVKATLTNMDKCSMTRDMLAKMLDEIYAASVRPFLETAVGLPWYHRSLVSQVVVKLFLDLRLPRPCRRPVAFTETLTASAIPALDETRSQVVAPAIPANQIV